MSCYLEFIEEFVFIEVWPCVFVVYRVDGTIGICVYVRYFFSFFFFLVISHVLCGMEFENHVI